MSRFIYSEKQNLPEKFSKCGICKVPFLEGDEMDSFALCPIDDENIHRMIDDRPYTSTACLVHSSCLNQ